MGGITATGGAEVCCNMAALCATVSPSGTDASWDVSDAFWVDLNEGALGAGRVGAGRVGTILPDGSSAKTSKIGYRPSNACLRSESLNS